MNWMKEADQLGKYVQTIEGFRIYQTKAGQDTKGFRLPLRSRECFAAVDQSGCRFDGTYWTVLADIRAEAVRRSVLK